MRRITLVLVLLLAAPAGAEEPGATGRVGPFVGIEGLDVADPAHRDPARLALLGGAGRLLGRTRAIAWSSLEPVAPVMGGRHLRDWDVLDPAVAAWTAAGLDVVLVLDPRSSWASQSAEDAAWRREVRSVLPEADAEALIATARGATPPLEERWDDWEVLVRDVVERFDGDGEGDVEGARLRWLQVIERPASADDWLGSAAEYGRLLNVASQGAQRASFGVPVVHGLVDLATLGHPPGRTEAEMLARLRRMSGEWPQALVFEVRRALELTTLTVSLGGLFEAVPHAGSEHLADERADLLALRDVLGRGSNPGAETWLAGTRAERHGAPDLSGARGPDDEERRLRSRWAGTARRRADGQWGLAAAWRARGRAFDVVRSLATARAAGASRVFVGGCSEGEGLDVFVAPREGGGWRRMPAWYALRQAQRLLAPHTTVEVRRIGRTCAAYRFAMTEGATLPWVALIVLDPDVSWAGHPRLGPVVKGVAVPLPDGRYVVEQTSLSDGDPKRRTVDVQGGGLRLELDAAPVWVYPEIR